MSKKRAIIARMLLLIIALFSIVLGFLKIFTHYNSVWRSGLLDYVVAIGAVLGGIFLIAPKGSKVFLTVNFAFIIFEAYKLAIDYHDFNDVLLCGTAIVCLFVPIINR
jgi:hypothetical protein